MLTKSVLNTLRDAAGLTTFSNDLSSNELIASDAANANRYDHHAAMARRNRRARRAERASVAPIGGWTVRLW